MMRHVLVFAALAAASFSLSAKGITFKATDRPAVEVFSELMQHTGYNFSYDASLLRGMRVSVNAVDAPIGSVLDSMFAGKGISYSIHGHNIILKKSSSSASTASSVVVSGYVREKDSGEAVIGAIVRSGNTVSATNSAGHYSLHTTPGPQTISVSYPGFTVINRAIDIASPQRIDFLIDESGLQSLQLGEVTVEADRNSFIALHSTDIGRLNLTRADITSTPVMFGESDVIKTLQLQPGVSSGVEGLAAMYVHGGAGDENLYMLDNVPIYQINHFGGLFSAFNTEAIKNVDFYKSSFPARYDGRLSSVMSVNTRDGNLREHHGSLKLGLTSGAFNIDGPIVSDKTTYSFAMRRSWFELISVPGLAIYNSTRSDSKTAKTVAHYSFSDINAKINHHFNDRSQIHAMFYYGDDYLKGGDKHMFTGGALPKERRQSDISRLQWGNIIGSIGWRMQFSSVTWGEITAAYSKYRSTLRNSTSDFLDYGDGFTSRRDRDYRFRNRISDWSVRADFGVSPAAGHKLTFGASYTLHRFTPSSVSTVLWNADSVVTDISVVQKVNAGEGAAYIGYEAELTPRLRIEAGMNAGIFNSSGKSKTHLSPRISSRWAINDMTSVKAGYSRMNQYVHQLVQSALALPTDQWVPVCGDLKPQSADKIFAGIYKRLYSGLTVSAEIYYKWMHNLLDYHDYFYLMPQETPWEQLLCVGSGTAKGLDLMVSRDFGRITGHLAYSLLWADRTFPDKNNGRRFPARFDNRHKINILLNWKINDRWELNAAWTGMSGNRISLSYQDYELLPAPGLPYFGNITYTGSVDLGSSPNNYRLPFYHRLDLSAVRHTARGMWNFSLYNAYCNMNAISVRKIRDDYSGYRYEKFRLIPVIPSVSYTWFF